jgi:hypothetical protein
MKLRTIKRSVLFALLGLLLTLGAAGWLRQNRQPPANATDSAIGTGSPENAPFHSARTAESSARVTRVAPSRNSMLDAAEGTVAGSSEPARAESFDPAGVIAWSESLEHGSERMAFEPRDSPERDDLLQRAAAAWLQSDLSAALEWAKAGEDTTSKRVVIRQHIDNLLASNNPSDAVAWLERIPEPVARDALVSRVGEAWGRIEGQVAWQWATSLPEGETREIAIQTTLSSWAEQQPIEAATAAVEQLPPHEQSRGVLAVLLSWTQRDPRAAASWVSLFPESPLRETATQNVVGNWAMQDADLARQWLAGLPAGASRDAGLLTWESLEGSLTRELISHQ